MIKIENWLKLTIDVIINNGYLCDTLMENLTKVLKTIFSKLKLSGCTFKSILRSLKFFKSI